MTALQTDILDIYNNLVVFSNETLKSTFPKPIKVRYDSSLRSTIFEQSGKVVLIPVLNYYCLDLNSLKEETYLLPKDYDELMYNLQLAINSGQLLEDRTCLSPENYGFDIYSINKREIEKGPDIISRARIISGKSWFFKFKTRVKYKL